MSYKLYVTNVPILVDLHDLFGPYGTVRDLSVVTVYGGERGTKAGLVDMGSEAERAAAIEGVDGMLHAGGVIRACVATARHETDADHTSLFGPMNMTADEPQAVGPGPADTCGVPPPRPGPLP